MPNMPELIDSIISREFKGKLVADRNLNDNDILQLFAAINITSGLSQTIEFLDLANYNVRKQGGITSVPKLKGFRNLKFLSIAGHQLKTVPDGWLDDCVSLEKIYLHSNKIMTLQPELFKNCKKLKIINLNSNDLRRVPAALLRDCESLEEIYIQNNNLIEIPYNFTSYCRNLKKFLYDNVPVAASPFLPRVNLSSATNNSPVDALELQPQFAAKLHESREATVNVLLEQANFLTPQNSVQNQAIISKMEELIWRTCKAEERAAKAEEIALMAIAELRNFEAQTKQSLEFISEHMTQNEKFLYDAIVRINQLGRAFTILSAEIGKNNQYATICNALNEGKYHGAATFMIAFVSKFTTEDMFAKLAVNKKFKFEYGAYGMVTDTLVAIANLVPVAGVGAAATLVQTTVRMFEDRKKITSANKIVNTTGKIVGGAEELATRIAVSILQLNGHIIAKCTPEDANSIAKLCFDAAIKYINAAPKDQTEISAEEIAYAIMSGKFLDPKSSFYGYILSFDVSGCLLATRSNSNNATKPREWLSDILLQYGNSTARFDDVLELPPMRTNTLVYTRKSVAVTPALNNFNNAAKNSRQATVEPEPLLRVKSPKLLVKN